MAGVVHLKRICKDYIFRDRRSTRDMFIRDVRRSGRWFPERGCILEHQMLSLGKMILRDRCSTSYDLASLFSWQAQYFRQVLSPPLSPSGFLFLKLLLPPCAALLVIIMENPSPALTSETFIWKSSTALPSAQRWQPWCAAKIGVEFGTKIISLGNRQIKLQSNSQVVANQLSIGNQWFGVPIL